MNLPSISISDIAAFLALTVALWSAIQTGRFNRRQNDFCATADRLNQLLISREAVEAEQQRKADISANFVKIAKSDYRLKVFNRGAAAARNVRLEILDGSQLFPKSELAQKFPFPALERQQHVDVMVSVTLGTPRRAHLRLIWTDEAGTEHVNDIWRDVY
jgi:hypothetical protein